MKDTRANKTILNNEENNSPDLSKEKVNLGKSLEELLSFIDDKIDSNSDEDALLNHWQDNADDTIDARLNIQSENAYIDIVKDIVKTSNKQLKEQNESKKSIKNKLIWFFMIFICCQYLALIVLLFFRCFQSHSFLSDKVIITYITSVFAETLGAIIFMVKYSFNSDQEVRVLKILHNVISEFKKFSN